MSTDRPRESGADEPDESPGDSAPRSGAADPAPAAGVTGSEPASLAKDSGVDAATASADDPETADRDAAVDAAAADDAPARPKRLRTVLALAAVLLGLDLLTKIIMVAQLTPGEPVYLIGKTVRFTLVRNPGAAFSMGGTGMTWLLTLIATAVVIGVIRIGSTLRSLPWAIGLGMVLGGALGNLVDRLFRSPGPLQGHVVDFVAVGWWPVFNVADSAIVCGAILLVTLTLFGFEPDGTRMQHAEGEKEEKTA
ncbi:signal peptidase II [Nocardia sp. NPDC055321]